MSEAPRACPGCGGTDLEPGWVDDVRYASVRWVPRPVRRRVMALADQGSTSRRVRAYRCTACSRLEMYAERD